MRTLLRWIDEQTGLVSSTKRFLEYPMPAGIGWMHTLGALALFLFLVEIATGVFLGLYYVPTPDHAYQSIGFIQTLPLGKLVRGLHHFATDALALVVGLHVLRTFLWGAYKKPRQVIWSTGVILLVLTMGFTITGVLLPWDQNGYWATKIRLSLVNTLPVLGPLMQQAALGEKSLGAVTLSRFYALHLFFLPGLMIALVIFHVFQVRVKGVTPPWRRVGEEQDVPKPILFYPDHMVKIGAVCLGALAILVALGSFHGAPLEPPADPTSTYPAHTHWYFLYLFEFVHFFTGKWEFIGSVLIPSMGLFAYLVLPFVDRNPERRLARRPFAVFLAASVFIAVTILGIKGSESTPRGPKLTPLAMQGEKVFLDRRCNACHRINGGGGVGGTDLAASAGTRNPTTVEAYIRDPQKLEPRSIMPKASLPPEQMTALVSYVSSLTRYSVMPAEAEVGPPRPDSHRSPTFMLDHKFEVRKDAAACAECHQPTFCQSCHQKRKPDSHLVNWLPRHAGASETSGAYCQVCHAKQMCDNCHRELLHGPGWLDVHARSGAQFEQKCVQCHARNFCNQCHQGARPPSHRQPDFRMIHGTLAGTQNCAQCHGSNACVTCHTKSNPHPKGWEKTHGPQAVARGADCATCHTNKQAFCDSCHKLPMPHPTGWIQQHRNFAMTAGANCSYCHEQRECATCHRTEKPASHTADWIQKHGTVARGSLAGAASTPRKSAKAAGANCTFCHQQRDCTGCHHSTMPASHTPDWRQKHGKVAKAGTQNCAMCHSTASCNACHQLPMPHPAKYQATHSADAKRSESACANCHKQSFCLQCHEKDEIHIPAASLPSDFGFRIADVGSPKGRPTTGHGRSTAAMVRTFSKPQSEIRNPKSEMSAALMGELFQRLRNVEANGCPVMEARRQESRSGEIASNGR